MRSSGILKITFSGFLAAISLWVPFQNGTNASLGKITSGSEVPYFEESSCMFDLPSGAVPGEDLKCGYLVVPETHADPDGANIRLAVVVLKSKSPVPQPDPLVMAQGGPGRLHDRDIRGRLY